MPGLLTVRKTAFPRHLPPSHPFAALSLGPAVTASNQSGLPLRAARSKEPKDLAPQQRRKGNLFVAPDISCDEHERERMWFPPRRHRANRGRKGGRPIVLALNASPSVRRRGDPYAHVFAE